VRRRVDRILNVAEMREEARRLPRVVLDAIDGGAGDEVTLRANRTAYERIWIKPKALVDVRVRDMSTTVLGTRISLPVMTAPCSFGRMANSEAELAVARASAAAGTIYVCPGGSSYPPERVMAAADGPKWYQLYLPGHRVLEMSRLELDRTMAFAGCASLRDLNSSFVGQEGR
jgi:(S)-mandelate dehydrogenase